MLLAGIPRFFGSHRMFAGPVPEQASPAASCFSPLVSRSPFAAPGSPLSAQNALAPHSPVRCSDAKPNMHSFSTFMVVTLQAGLGSPAVTASPAPLERWNQVTQRLKRLRVQLQARALTASISLPQ